jgi:hypothetical protein
MPLAMMIKLIPVPDAPFITYLKPVVMYFMRGWKSKSDVVYGNTGNGYVLKRT